jgi:hypothetical protein
MSVSVLQQELELADAGVRATGTFDDATAMALASYLQTGGIAGYTVSPDNTSVVIYDDPASLPDGAVTARTINLEGPVPHPATRSAAWETNWTPWLIGGGVVLGLWLLARK